MALTLVQNLGLDDAATGTRTSSICEPTAAANGSQLMVTGNWFASTSVDGGASWSFVDPFTRLPSAAGGFCCDQVVLYNARHRIWIWLLQYSSSGTGNNVFRIAVCREASFGAWYYWDVSPRDLNAGWTTTWLDYPDMAYTDENLFVTFNAFIGNAWQRAVVFRFGLATLAAGGSLSYRWWTTKNNGSIRLCRGPGRVMYMGSHNSLSQLRIFQWPDGAAGISSTDVDVRPWSAGSWSAPGPDGVNWLGRTDQRITGAWMGAGKIGFLWSANRDTSHPLPYIRAACFDKTSKALVEQPDLWSTKAAWAYPAAAANANGVAGMTAFYGGGDTHPSHAIGVKSGAGWEVQLAKTSTHGPADGAWGDYLSCHAHHADTAQWVASGYTLQGGNTRQHVEPRYVRFRA